MKSMATAVAILFCFALGTTVHAKLNSGPTISSVVLAPQNPDVIYLRIDSLPCKAAVSADGGKTFQVMDERKIPADASTNLSVGNRRYVLVRDQFLLRSDDGGTTWTPTGAATFIWGVARAELKNVEQWFWDEYASRMPRRSDWWQAAFGLFAVVYLLVTLSLLWGQGRLLAIWTGLRGLVVLLVVCGVLLNLHFIVRALMIAQWPSAYWNSSAGYSPTAQLGVVMNIAARPLPLLAYLLALWPLLPGSLSVMSGTGPGASATRRRVALGVAVTLGAALALFHLYLLFWGPLLGW